MVDRWRETYTDHNHYDGSQEWRESRLLAHEILLQRGEPYVDESGELVVTAEWGHLEEDDSLSLVELSERQAPDGYATYQLSSTNLQHYGQEISFTFSSREEDPEDIRVGPDIEWLRSYMKKTTEEAILQILQTATFYSDTFDFSQLEDREKIQAQFWKIIGTYALDMLADQEALRELASQPPDKRRQYPKAQILNEVLGYQGIDPLVIRSALDHRLDEMHEQMKHRSQETLRPVFSDAPDGTTDIEQI